MKNVLLVGNWASSPELVRYWSRLLATCSGLAFVDDTYAGPIHAAVICNHPPGPRPPHVPPSVPVILASMEPHMSPANWGEWGNSSLAGKTIAGWAITHHLRPPRELNWAEWHLRHTAEDLRMLRPEAEKSQPPHVISAVLSSKHSDPGHAKRIALVRHLQAHHSADVTVHVYGRSNGHGFDNFMGSAAVPLLDKADAILPYRYHIAFENNSIPGYITEKLYDGVLMGAHCFYWGAPDAHSHFGAPTPGTLSPSSAAPFTQLPQDADIPFLAALIVRLVKADAWGMGTPARNAMREYILDTLAAGPRINSLLGWPEREGACLSQTKSTQ